MLNDPAIIIAVGGVLWKFLTDSGKKRGFEPVRATATDIEVFTGTEPWNQPGSLTPQRARKFDAPVAVGLCKFLQARSARLIDARKDLGIDTMPVHAYEIVNATGDLPAASEVVEQAAAQGHVVLASLSVLLLLVGKDVPGLLIVGGPGAEGLAIAGTDPKTGFAVSYFARLYPPSPQVVETAGETVVADTEPAPPEPAAPAEVNGVAKHAPAAVDAQAATVAEEK